ncbi:Single-stranded DNA binding protein [Haloarcula rubripromontorii]|uniref:Replication factor A n=1 Tax=Haloarcula rubripromontorii TaxID=1705562 RepID=A0A0M9AGS8_9EURY|nr:Single-stranded DNA binding protein [Haloarcula rubripromontorii]KOX91757.1 replication factor A [Haloarcula rubripromontorii]NLV06394.1 Single-stranded DNA binding protein [Haloarcula rubripromontorii]
MSLEDHAEELASDLGVDKEEVTRDLKNLVNYSVPMDEAKQSLRRKYGDGSSGGDATPSSKAISEVSTDDSNVTVTAVVLTSGRRSIQYNGEQHVIREGELADETGKISYTAWDGFSGDLEPGQTVRLGNAGVREWDGQPELNLGDSTDPEVVDETLDIDYDVGGRAALQDLAPGDRGISAEVQVLECEQKVIDGRDGETTILSGVLGDESGRLPFTDWEPHDEIEEGASVRLDETFVREFRGAPSVNVSEFSTVTALDRTVEVAEDAPRLSIREAVESGGLFDVELAGNVIEVRDGSGLIERCPECGRVIQNGQCRSHGAVEGEDDLRTKAILDDGTATVTAVLDAELTARVYGGDLDDAREHARDAMDKEVVADRISDRIVGREFVVRGSLSVDEYGANLTASTFTEADDDPAARAQTLLQEADT